VVAEPLLEQVLGEGWTVQDRFTGAEMERWTYQRPLDLLDWPGGRGRRISWCWPTT
jgi:isoleucyl-tRNA synthetase